MKNYIYDDVNWKMYQYVNNGTVEAALGIDTRHRTRFFGFLHQSLGVMNYTCSGEKVKYEVRQIQDGYRIEVIWNSTKLKSETIAEYLKNVNESVPVDVGQSEWRHSVITNLMWLKKYCRILEYEYSQSNAKKYPSILKAEITFENLEDRSQDIPKENFNYNPTQFSVPHELLATVISENVQEAVKHLGVDSKKVHALLEPMAGREFLADFLLGVQFYLYEEKPNTALDYFQRAVRLMKDDHSELASMMLEFIGTIEFSEKREADAAETSFRQAILLGAQESVLKLAYIYLQQVKNEQKAEALTLAIAGEKILQTDSDEIHRISGYHIVASIYLWNGYLDDASAVHEHFLSNHVWCLMYPNLVEAYLIFALALEDQDFISNLITDFPILRSHFKLIIDTWYNAIVNPKSEAFTMNMIPIINKVNNSRELYQLRKR